MEGVKCNAMEALYIIFILAIIDGGRCFRIIGFTTSGPGDFLLSKPLNALSLDYCKLHVKNLLKADCESPGKQAVKIFLMHFSNFTYTRLASRSGKFL